MPTGSDKHKRTVFIVDDHPLVREWLSSLINQQSDLEVSGEAGEKKRALSLITAGKPDIAVVDISIEGGSGLELIKDIKIAAPGVAVIVLSMHDESLYAERALRAGARGYVMKREVTKNILEAIRQVLGGQLYMSSQTALAMAEKLVEGRTSLAESPVEILSDRELEVFQLLGRGLSTRQVADQLNVSMKTVQAFCARIKEKLNLPNAPQLLREAVRWNDSQNSQ